MAGDLEFMILFMIFIIAVISLICLLGLTILLMLKISEVCNDFLWKIKDWIDRRIK